MNRKKARMARDGSPPPRTQPWLKMSEKHEALRLQFIHTELDLAETFCQLAATSTSDPRSRRNISNAEQAYQVVVRFFDEAALEPEVGREIAGRLRHLEAQLDD